MILTQEDLQAIGSLINTAITEAVKPLPTKDELQAVRMELYDELNRQYNENNKRFSKLESMASTLLLQSDNTALLLRLINRQAEELEAVKAEVQEIKRKLA